MDSDSDKPEVLSLADDLLHIAARCANLPKLDTRTAEEILGYDEDGLAS